MGFFDLHLDRRSSRVGRPLEAERQQTPPPRVRCDRDEDEAGLLRHDVRARPTNKRPYFPKDQGHLLLELLGQCDDLRRQQETLARKLRRALTKPTDDEDAADLTKLQQSWSEFVSQGGTTREDLVKFMLGERLGSTVRVNRHLRLVRSNPEQKRGGTAVAAS